MSKLSVKVFDSIYANLFNDATSFPDSLITVKSNNETKHSFKTHKLILSSKNLILKSIFQNQQDEILFENENVDVVKSFIQFYYSGKVECEKEEDISSLLKLSHLYFSPEIVTSIVNYFLQNEIIFTDKQIIDILSIFYTNCKSPCQYTKIKKIESNEIQTSAANNQQQEPVKIATYPKTFKYINQQEEEKIEDEKTSDIYFKIGEKYNEIELFKKLKEKLFEQLNLKSFTIISSNEQFLKEISFNFLSNFLKNCLIKINFQDITLCLLNWFYFDQLNRLNYSLKIFNLLKELIILQKQQFEKINSPIIDENEILTSGTLKTENGINLNQLTNLLSKGLKISSISFKTNTAGPLTSRRSPANDNFNYNNTTVNNNNLKEEEEEEKQLRIPSPITAINTTTQKEKVKSIEDEEPPKLNVFRKKSTSPSSQQQRTGRSRSVFVRPKEQQEGNSFLHLKKLTSPFLSLSHSEQDAKMNRNVIQSPPKTRIEVEEDGYTDWEQVGATVITIPIKSKVEEKKE